jgi:hypothetical protein
MKIPIRASATIDGKSLPTKLANLAMVSISEETGRCTARAIATSPGTVPSPAAMTASPSAVSNIIKPAISHFATDPLSPVTDALDPAATLDKSLHSSYGDACPMADT